MAQLYVGPSSYTYIYNTNQVVFVENDIELNAATSFFYLRNEGQLLQGTTVAGANKGIGNLSTFQEGTVNNFAYNYWCSPVGGNVATAGNSLFGITQLGVPTTTTTTNAATILAMNNYDGTSAAGTLSIAPYWIWRFSVNDTYADWIFSGASTNIAAGEGFSMKGVSGTDATVVDGVANNAGSNQRYDFRGKPNDGTIDIPVAYDITDGGQFTLTGNPYPSTIDLSMFLTDATNSTGIAYFWEHDKTVNTHYVSGYVGGYGTFSPVSRGGTGIYVPATYYTYDGAGNQGGSVASPGTIYERRFTPIGQGFMIEGAANGIVQMKNSYRVFVKEGIANNSQFERTASNSTNNKGNTESNFLPAIKSVSGFDYTTVSKLPIPQIRFKTTIDSAYVSQIVLAFEPTATDDVDFAMDAKSINEDLEQEIYFDINDNPYIINVVAFDEAKKIPLGFRNTYEALYKIEIDKILNFDDSQNIYIHDTDNNVYHDIKDVPFTVTMPADTNSSRFEITFNTESTLNVIDNIIKDFYVTQNNDSQKLTISNPKTVGLRDINVYDISGKLIFTKTNLGSDTEYSFTTSAWSDGVYIVNLTTENNQTENKKVIVNNIK